MKTHTQKRLLDALEACKAIGIFVANATFANCEKDLLLCSAVERQFEIIGEALHQAEIGEPGATDLVPELHRIVGCVTALSTDTTAWTMNYCGKQSNIISPLSQNI
jgi:hypothetical protein